MAGPGAAVVGPASTRRLLLFPALREDVLDLAQQLLQGKGLADVVDRPFLQALHAVLGLRARGEHGHRDVRRLLVHAQELQDLPSVHLRHHDVEEDEVRLLDLRGGEGLLPAGRGHDLVTLLLEHELEEVQDVVLVVHDQDLLLHTLARPSAACSPRWRRTSAMRARRSKGLLMYRFAPRARPRRASVSSPRAVSTSTGMAAVVSLRESASSTSNPLISGIMMSRITRSGRLRAISSRACRPWWATWMRSPSL